MKNGWILVLLLLVLNQLAFRALFGIYQRGKSVKTPFSDNVIISKALFHHFVAAF